MYNAPNLLMLPLFLVLLIDQQRAPENSSFFYAQLGGTGTGAFYAVPATARFPLQFGRHVLCSPALLNTPEKVDWKQCALSVDEETQLASAYKIAFRAFDFNF